MIGNDDEIDTNTCTSSMLQDNPIKFSGQSVSDISHPNHYQSAVLRKLISNEFSNPASISTYHLLCKHCVLTNQMLPF